MKLKIEDKYIYNEEGKLLGVLAEDVTEQEKAVIVKGAEAYESIDSFVDQINSGSFKLRAATKVFEQILKSTN